MADPWKAPEDEDADAAARPRKFERSELQSTLADLIRTGDPGPTEATAATERPHGMAGHEALAALAAEVAQATVTAPKDIDESRVTDTPRTTRIGTAAPTALPLGAPRDGPADRPRGLGDPDDRPRHLGGPDDRPRPLGGPDDRPRPFGPLSGDRASAPGSPASGPGSPAATPPPPGAPPVGMRPLGPVGGGAERSASGLSGLPAPMRLQSPSSAAATKAAVAAAATASAAAAATIEQPTISLRRRPTVSGPASIAAEPTVPGHEAPTIASTPAVRAAAIEAWLPSEDDILPPHPTRRGRTFRRAR